MTEFETCCQWLHNIFFTSFPWLLLVKHLRHSKDTGDCKISTQNPSHSTFFVTIELSQKLAGGRVDRGNHFGTLLKEMENVLHIDDWWLLKSCNVLYA